MKHPLASVTNWAGFFTLLQGVLTSFGVTVDVETASTLASGVVQSVIGLIVLWGRARASQPIKWR